MSVSKMRRKRQDRENTESANKKKEPQGYREEMKKASQDLRFMQDCKDAMEHFS